MATEEVRIQELKRINERDGEVRASVVVKESKPKKAPLHNEFEWDDQKAADEYRLSQARRLIRITVHRSDDGVKSRYVHVPVTLINEPTATITEREGSYKPIRVVIQNENDYELALNQLQVQVNSINRTIREMQRLAGKKVKPLIKTLEDAMVVAKDTIKLMREIPAG